jgi:hypothetical protein
MPVIKKPNEHFDATTYSGNGGTQSITNVNFQPDWLWVKQRSEARSNLLWDSVRGSNLGLITNTTSAESAQPSFTGFLSNGFGISNTDSSDITNKNAQTYVGWVWKAGGAAVTDTAGSISSQVSANPTAGFSIVTYTGTGSNATVGHGLGVAPSMIIAKKRSSTGSWQVYHSAISGMAGGYLTLNGTSGFTGENSTIWNNTAPTSSVFSLGTDTDANANGATTVAYCWAPIAGYSAFGSYTGNGSADGPFVYLGFRPKFVLWKRTNTTGDWTILDTSRNPYNYADLELFPNLSDAETVIGGGLSRLDIVSNGFKVRGADSYQNANGSTYIYMAFAEAPFKYSSAR